MENKDNGDFQINVYSPGNFIAKEIHISGDLQNRMVILTNR